MPGIDYRVHLPTGEMATLAALLYPPGRALDLGCGEGVDSLLLAAGGWEVDAIDADSDEIRKAKRRRKGWGLRNNPRFLTDDLFRVVPPWKKYDPVHDRLFFHNVQIGELLPDGGGRKRARIEAATERVITLAAHALKTDGILVIRAYNDDLPIMVPFAKEIFSLYFRNPVDVPYWTIPVRWGPRLRGADSRKHIPMR